SVDGQVLTLVRAQLVLEQTRENPQLRHPPVYEGADVAVSLLFHYYHLPGCGIAARTREPLLRLGCRLGYSNANRLASPLAVDGRSIPAAAPDATSRSRANASRRLFCTHIDSTWIPQPASEPRASTDDGARPPQGPEGPHRAAAEV